MLCSASPRDRQNPEKMIANAAKTPNEAMGMIGAEAVATNARKVVADVLSTVTNVRE